MDAVNFLSTFMLGSDEPWICYTNIKNIELYLRNIIYNIIGIFKGDMFLLLCSYAMFQ